MKNLLLNNARSIVLALLAVMFSLTLTAQDMALNRLELNDSISDTYSFLVTGHIYGDSHNKSGLPAASISANIDRLQMAGVEFIALTGDVFRDVKNDHKHYEERFFAVWNIPLFNAPGNHDLGGDFYAEELGIARNFTFSIAADQFVFLDAEKEDSRISGEQLEMLRSVLVHSTSGSNVFIFSHRPIWAESWSEFEGYFTKNTRGSFGDNFQEDILPLLNESPAKDIYWFSGSTGGGPASFFYHEVDGLHFIQSAIRNRANDAVLKVDLNKGEVSFSTISLSAMETMKLEDYNMDFWSGYKEKDSSFSLRLLPLYIKNCLSHRYFWYGVLSALLLIFLVRIFRKRISK